MDPEDLVSVVTVTSPTEAELIRSALQSVGIACEIGGESQASFVGVFEINILVHANDEDSARKYLRKLHREKLARKKKRLAAKKARQADGASEAIQEKPPRKKPPA